MLYIITTTTIGGGSCSCSEYEVENVLKFVLEHEDKKIDLPSLKNEYVDYLSAFRINKKNKNAFIFIEWLKTKKGFKEPKYTHIDIPGIEYL